MPVCSMGKSNTRILQSVLTLIFLNGILKNLGGCKTSINIRQLEKMPYNKKLAHFSFFRLSKGR